MNVVKYHFYRKKDSARATEDASSADLKIGRRSWVGLTSSGKSLKKNDERDSRNGSSSTGGSVSLADCEDGGDHVARSSRRPR